MEGSIRPYHYDWYTHCIAMVHLRFSEGLLPFAPTPTPRDARKLAIEVGSTKAIVVFRFISVSSCVWFTFVFKAFAHLVHFFSLPLNMVLGNIQVFETPP